jgi:hypothetical protein
VDGVYRAMTATLHCEIQTVPPPSDWGSQYQAHQASYSLMSTGHTNNNTTRKLQSEADAARVVAYILATKTHSWSSAGGGDGDEEEEDLRLFLDIDMSVLGQPREGELGSGSGSGGRWRLLLVGFVERGDVCGTFV